MKNILISFLILFFYTASGQRTGYAGKKFILKTDVLNGLNPGFTNLEAEYAITRKLSIGFGYKFYTGKYKQILTNRLITYIGDGVKANPELTIYPQPLPAAKLVGQSLKAQMKFYFGRVLMAAPRGFYISASYEGGVAKLTGADWLTAVYATANNTPYVKSFVIKSDVEVRKISFDITEATLGFQQIYGGRWTMDISGGVSFTRFNTNSDKPALTITSLTAPRFVPAVYTTVANSSKEVAPYNVFFGVVAHLKIGMLIF